MASGHAAIEAKGVSKLFQGAGQEAVYLDEVAGRQLLHVTFGSVLTQGRDASGRTFKEGILEVLHRHADLHAELLETHFVRHLSQLNAG